MSSTSNPVASSTSNPVLPSIPNAFQGLNTDGTPIQLKKGPDYSHLSDSHLQGIAQYGNYFLITQNRYNESEGKLYFFSISRQEFVGSMHFPVPGTDTNSYDNTYNHPGGIQVIGDYLLVPIQTQNYKKSVVQLWDLSPLQGGKNLNITQISSDFLPASNQNEEVGGIGIVNRGDNFLVAACNNQTVYFYQSTGNDLVNATFNYLFTGTLNRSASEVCLLTDSTDVIYLMSFEVESDGASYKDYATLYSIDLEASKIALKQDIHFVTNCNDPTFAGVHFRWGAGIYFPDSDALGLLATQRVMTDDCAINSFTAP